MKLWIDDVRPAPEGWLWVKTADDAIKAITSTDFDEISFDHDLGEDSKSGYEVICELEILCYMDEKVVPHKLTCHSSNPPGKKNIELAIKSLETLKEKRGY